MELSGFKSKKISKSADIILNGNISTVFPLFGAFEERKWAQGWESVLIFPDTEIIEEGTTFKTPAHNSEETHYTWIVSAYQPKKHLIRYLVFTQNRYWTITVKCTMIDDNKTKAEITYSYFGLNKMGNHLNKHALTSMFKHNLKDWEAEINTYLSGISYK